MYQFLFETPGKSINGHNTNTLRFSVEKKSVSFLKALKVTKSYITK